MLTLLSILGQVLFICLYLSIYLNYHSLLIAILIILIIFTSVWWVYEYFSDNRHSFVVFTLFMGTELLIFLTVLVVTLWSKESDSFGLGHWTGYPLVLTFLLVSSTLLLSYCYFARGAWYVKTFKVIVVSPVILFVLVQFIELYVRVQANSGDSFFTSSCFTLLGVHFFHLIIGLIFLILCYNLDDKFMVSKPFFGYNTVFYWHIIGFAWCMVYYAVYF
nr:cytochrome c oxidase subunit 3 [Haematoloechus sp. CW13H]